MVRQAISEFVSPEPLDPRDSHYVNVTSQCKRTVIELAEELNRSQYQVLEACVEGIQDLLERKELR